MNWVSSSLQLAGNLLESVDQHAALTLTGDAESDHENDEQHHAQQHHAVTDDDGLLSPLKTRVAHAADAVSATASSNGGESADESELLNAEGSTSQIGDDEAAAPLSGSARARSSPPNSGSSGRGSVALLSRSLPSPSPPHSASGVSVAASLDDECARLRRELTRARADAKAKDKALSAAQKRLRVCEDEIEALERECKDKIAEVHEELTRLRHEKDTDERNFVHALELKDAQAQTAVLELAALQEAKQLQANEVAALRAELARAVEARESLWTSAASATDDSEQLILALRTELDETLAALHSAKREHDASKQSMFARQAQLEKMNAELGTNVARLEREVAKAREAVTAAGTATSALPAASSSSFATLSDDYRRVQQTLVATKKTLRDETRANELMRQELTGARDELQRVKLALEASEQRAAQQLFVATRETEELRAELSRVAAASSHGASGTATESRIQTLTNRLVEKQETVDALRSKVTTLEIRLADAQGRSQRAEERLAEIERNGGVLDMEMAATPVGKRVRARPNRLATVITRVAPVVERSSRVVTALDVIDRWLLFLGRVFLSYPFARLGLLSYIALIHFWVFVVLSFHTSHLSEEVMQQHGADAAGVAADRDQVFPSSP